MIKKFVFVAALLLSFSSTAWSQVYLGPVVGYSASSSSVTVGDNDVETTEDGSGPYFGGFIGYRLAHILSIESGATYATQSLTAEIGDVSSELKFNYLNVPVILMLEFPSQFIVKARARAGVQFGFEMSCKTVTTVGGNDQEDDCADGTSKSMDIGAPLSLGVGIGLGEMLYLFLDGGYRLGLTDVSDIEGVEIRHNALFAQAGLSFGF